MYHLLKKKTVLNLKCGDAVFNLKQLSNNLFIKFLKRMPLQENIVLSDGERKQCFNDIADDKNNILRKRG